MSQVRMLTVGYSTKFSPRTISTASIQHFRYPITLYGCDIYAFKPSDISLQTAEMKVITQHNTIY